MLVAPYGWDQPDNAARIERLGVGLHVSRDRYSVTTPAEALDRLLNEGTKSAPKTRSLPQVTPSKLF
jgi:UDP:flavonoid glycosyltransferase YjiC (YdhE family)